jgi:predicted PurR-regulated permease PerM
VADPTDPPSPAPPPPGAQTPAPASVPAASARSLRFFAWMRRFAKLWGFALFCVFVVFVFRHVVLPFIFAILVTYILAPAVDRMARVRVAGRPFPRGLAVVILYINILAGLGLFIGYFIPKLSGDIARLFREVPVLSRKLNEVWVPKIGDWIDERFGAGVPAVLDPAQKPAPSTRADIIWEPLPDGKFRLDLSGMNLEVQPLPEGHFLITPPKADDGDHNGEGHWERSIKKWIADQVKSGEMQGKKAIEYGQKFVTGVVTGVARLVLVLMVAAFILIDLGRVRAFIRSLVPENYRQDYDRIAHGVDRGLSGVIRGQLLICIINGVLTYIGLVLFKVKYSLLLAGVACVMSLIPIFGSVLSSIPIVAVALISSGRLDLVQGVYVLGWILLIHFIEANFLNPKIMGDAARIHPVLVVFALIAGEYTYGLVGALFAVPVASIIQTLFVYFRRRDYARA